MIKFFGIPESVLKDAALLIHRDTRSLRYIPVSVNGLRTLAACITVELPDGRKVLKPIALLPRNEMVIADLRDECEQLIELGIAVEPDRELKRLIDEILRNPFSLL